VRGVLHAAYQAIDTHRRNSFVVKSSKLFDTILRYDFWRKERETDFRKS